MFADLDLSGTLPSAIGSRLTSLDTFWVSECLLSGSLASSWSGLTMLSKFVVQKMEQLRFNPNIMANWSLAQGVVAEEVLLEGKLPKNVQSFPDLRVLSLQNW